MTKRRDRDAWAGGANHRSIAARRGAARPGKKKRKTRRVDGSKLSIELRLRRTDDWGGLDSLALMRRVHQTTMHVIGHLIK
jgi:hypothetical protein